MAKSKGVVMPLFPPASSTPAFPLNLNNTTTSHPLTEQEKRRLATRRIFLNLCGATLAAGIAAPLDARFIEPYAIETTYHEAFLPHLPPDLDGFTVAHLTDPHRGPVTPDSVIQQAISLTAQLNPDMVVVTGDFVASQPSDGEAFAQMLAPLSPPQGIYACLGNHDYAVNADRIAESLRYANVAVLRNQATRLQNGLWIAGIEDTLRGNPDTPAALAPVPHDAPLVFLTHNPVGVWGVADRACLALSGHTHGGQIRVPGVPPALPPGMDGFPLVAGWGVFDQARLYVNRGVGMGMMPLRFRCRPEIAHITLRRGNQAPYQLPSLPTRAAQKTIRVAAKVYRTGRL
jgi:hypothetical protein